MSDLLTLQGVYGKLSKAVSDAGSQTAFAVKHGLSPQYVCDVLNCRRDPGDKIAAALGLTKVVMWKHKEKL